MATLTQPAAALEAPVKPGADRTNQLLAGIVVVATLLRLYRLDVGLWLDEALLYTTYAQRSFVEIVTTYETQNHHFLYSLLARVAFLLFGPSTWALRLPAVLFGVASIWALYLLGREVASRREALIAAALMTVSYHHVWFSQNARGYSGLLFWTLLSSYLLLRALRDGQARTWRLFAVALALGFYTHLTMVFVAFAQGLVLLGAAGDPRRRGWRTWQLGVIQGFGLAALLTFLLHAPALPAILSGEAAGEVSNVPLWRQPLWAVLEFVRGFQVSYSLGLLALGAVTVFGLGLAGYWRERPAIITLLIVPVATCAALNIGLGHHIWPRFFFFALGFGVLVAVRGSMLAGRWLGHKLRLSLDSTSRLETAAGLLLVLGAAPALLLVYGPKQDFAGALEFVERERQPGDVVVTAGLAVMPFKEVYRADWAVVETRPELEVLRTRAARTWLVYTLATHFEAVYPDLNEAAQREFELVKEFPGTVGDGAIIVRRSPASPTRQARTCSMAFTSDTRTGPIDE
jgi:hypothetical protein